MQVAPSQLIPGCILIEDVYGKTNQPIVPKNTTLTAHHITFLNKFLIEKVEVSSKLVHGDPFIINEPAQELPRMSSQQVIQEKQEDFINLYQKTVILYKELFTRWQGNTAIDISVIKRVIYPLLDKLEEAEQEIIHLHRYTTPKNYFFHHSVATAVLSAYIAKESKFKDYRQVGLAGFLADCGMAKVDYALLEKSAPLSNEEYEEIKKHPTYSYRLVENISSLPLKVKLGILQHHEKLDGSGYPLGVEKEKIHSFAACVSLADTYHAMTSNRYYQSSQSPLKVMEEILHNHLGKYDHIIVQTFIKSLSNLAIGKKVRLSNKQEAIIVFMDGKFPSRPVVRLLKNQEIVSLFDHKELQIDALVY